MGVFPKLTQIPISGVPHRHPSGPWLPFPPVTHPHFPPLPRRTRPLMSPPHTSMCAPPGQALGGEAHPTSAFLSQPLGGLPQPSTPACHTPTDRRDRHTVPWPAGRASEPLSPGPTVPPKHTLFFPVTATIPTAPGCVGWMAGPRKSAPNTPWHQQTRTCLCPHLLPPAPHTHLLLLPPTAPDARSPSSAPRTALWGPTHASHERASERASERGQPQLGASRGGGGGGGVRTVSGSRAGNRGHRPRSLRPPFPHPGGTPLAPRVTARTRLQGHRDADRGTQAAPRSPAPLAKDS